MMGNLELTLSNTNGVQTMSSLAIVELINAERQDAAGMGEWRELLHKNFLAKVEEVLKELAAKFLATNNYTSGKGVVQERKIYEFPQREACLMLMSYSYDLQAQVYDAWVRAEKKLQTLSAPKLPNFEDPAEAAIAWAEEYKAKQALRLLAKKQHEDLKEAQPKIEFHDAVTTSELVHEMKDAGNVIGYGRTKFMAWLRKKGFITIDNKAMQSEINNKRMTVHMRDFTLSSGRITVAITSYVTGKGIIAYRKMLQDEGIIAK